MTRRARPARARAPARGLLEHFSAWLTRHAQVAVSSLGQLTRTPGATSMTTSPPAYSPAGPADLPAPEIIEAANFAPAPEAPAPAPEAPAPAPEGPEMPV